MMKSKLAFAVFLFGWFIITAYIIHIYDMYRGEALKHLFIPEKPSEIFLGIMILVSFIGSTTTAYLINERKKLLNKTQLSERQLRRTSNEWRTTFDSMPHGVMLLDNEFNIIKVNPYIANFTEKSFKELLSEKCYKIIHGLDKPREGCLLPKSASTRSTKTSEWYDSNRGKYFMMSVTPILDDKGFIVSYAHLTIDITNTKEKEKRLYQAKEAFFNMLKDLNSAHNEMAVLYQDLVISYSIAIDAKSPWTKGHSERVTHYALSIAKSIGLKNEDLEVLQTAALLHDIGKIGTYDTLLDKPGKLTAEEFKLIMEHPAKGIEILAPIKGLENILPAVRSHHEKLDGTGYPEGLKGDEIPLLARILCVADSFDSMTSNRPYRPAPGKEYTISELKRCSGTQFDPQVIEAFLRVLKNEKVFVIT